MGRQSKYGQYRQHTVPRKKRTIKLSGAQEDDGKYYRCWFCGAINNIDRTAVADGFSNGNTYSIGVIDTETKMNSQGNFAVGVSGKTVVMMNGFVDSHSVGSVAESGCWSCGSLNSR